jgi:hypothetical protein
MRQKSEHPESPSERIVKSIRRATRKRHSSEEKIRISQARPGVVGGATASGISGDAIQKGSTAPGGSCHGRLVEGCRQKSTLSATSGHAVVIR